MWQYEMCCAYELEKQNVSTANRALGLLFTSIHAYKVAANKPAGERMGELPGTGVIELYLVFSRSALSQTTSDINSFGKCKKKKGVKKESNMLLWLK